MQEFMQTITNDPKLMYGLPSSFVSLLLLLNRIWFTRTHLAKCYEDMDFAIKSLEHMTLPTGGEGWLFDYYRVVYDIQFKDQLIDKIRNSMITAKASPFIYGLKLFFSNPFAGEIDIAGFPYSFSYFKLSR